MQVLTKLGHEAVQVDVPVGLGFTEDFTLYWGLLSTLATMLGPINYGRPFRKDRLDGLTVGLRKHYLRNLHRTPVAIRRLRRVAERYDTWIRGYDAVISPVLAHPTPKLGYLSPTVPFDKLMYRLTQYVVTTPLHNVAGTPGLAMPVGLSGEGLPLSVHLSGVRGGERTLLKLGYQLEAELCGLRMEA